jgi:DNA modification methylase
VNYTLHQGHVLTELATMPAESVQMVCTSPPYWGLRDYKIPPQVWGGAQSCEHDWRDVVATSETNYTDKRRWQHTRNGRDEQVAPEKRVGWKRQEIRHGAVCSACGAWAGSLGLESSVDLYVEHVVEVFRDVRRVLRSDGTLWLNLGDTYASTGKWGGSSGGKNDAAKKSGASIREKKEFLELKSKDLVGIPWRVAFALQADGWWLRSDIIWAKPNPMPESVTDRPTKAHEYLFLLTKSQTYYYDAEAIAEPCTHADTTYSKPSARDNFRRENSKRAAVHPGQTVGTHRPDRADTYPTLTRNKRTVWTIPTMPFKEAHFATFPEKLVEPCILAGTSERGACSKCMAPWARVVEKEIIPHKGATGTAYPKGSTANRLAMVRQEKRARGNDHDNAFPQAMTTGWRPTCACKKAGEPVPCVVFDPFTGSGTVGAVALRLGREFVGIELNPDYIALADARITAVAPLFVRKGN